MPFLKRAHPVVKEKVFVTVLLMNRVISMEMEKKFPELSFQIKDHASGRVSCTETWNYSQKINVTVKRSREEVFTVSNADFKKFLW